MKNLSIILLSAIFLLCSCRGGMTNITRGLNQSYLEFVVTGDNHYKDGVQVAIDDNTQFNAKVYKDQKSRVKGDIYAINKGAHSIKVYYKDELIYSQKIFIGTEETKKIQLP
ncbi:MAG: hypothetical protein LBQ31_03345 [Bacteroidales bacterium]|jgi:hypothetical protein|nr:hypothetical protein [Bacteroidales bacterium]